MVVSYGWNQKSYQNKLFVCENDIDDKVVAVVRKEMVLLLYLPRIISNLLTKINK